MKITIFDDGYADKGQYFLDDDNMVWMHGTILCRRLGFTNVSETITKHTDEDERRKEELNGKLVWFVSEPGIWGLILASKTAEAIEFKRKLKHEILPKIRASGAYVSPNITSEQLAALEEQIKILKMDNMYLDHYVGQLKGWDYLKFRALARDFMSAIRCITMGKKTIKCAKVNRVINAFDDLFLDQPIW